MPPTPASSRAARWAWLPIPLLLALIAALWVADLRTVYESRALMVLLNVVFTWLASLCICVLTARGWLDNGQPGLLMFGCGSLVWGLTSLSAALVVDRLNATITIHNLGVLGAAGCHLAGLLWHGRLARPRRWLVASYAGALGLAALIVWAALAGLTPLFFVQGEGGTLVRQTVLLLAVAMFGWVGWHMFSRAGRQPGSFYYWYGLGLGLVATGLTGVLLLQVQGGVLGWTNRLTQYLGSAYLFLAALAANKAGGGRLSLAALEEAWHKGELLPALRKGGLRRLAAHYGLAVLLVGAGFAGRMAISRWVGLGLPPFITFYPGVMLAAMVGGLGPGLLATGLGGAIVARWIMLPSGSLTMASPVDRLALLLFLGIGTLMSVAAEFYQRYRRKAAAYDRETALRETRWEKDFLANVLEQSSQPFAVGYFDGSIGLVNHAFEELTGYSAAELRSIDWATALTPPEWRELERQKVEELHLTGQPVRYEKEYVRKDGSRVRVELLAHLSPGAQGKPGYYYSFVTDITERERAAAALRLSEQRLRRFYESDLLGVIYWNMKGEITDANDKFLKMLGYSREDLAAGRIDWQHMTPPEYRHLDEASLKELQATGFNKLPFEKEYLHKDGTRVPILIAGAMFDEARVNGVAFVLDISRRKQAETDLQRRAQELRAANQELSQFNQIMVGRELRMIELKQEINRLCAEAGQPPRYHVPPAGAPQPQMDLNERG